MTNGGDAHGRTGKKKSGSKKAKGKTPQRTAKAKGIIPPSLQTAKDR